MSNKRKEKKERNEEEEEGEVGRVGPGDVAGYMLCVCIVYERVTHTHTHTPVCVERLEREREREKREAFHSMESAESYNPHGDSHISAINSACGVERQMMREKRNENK